MMAAILKIREVGQSLALTITKEAANFLKLDKGDKVSIELKNDSMIVRKVRDDTSGQAKR